MVNSIFCMKDREREKERERGWGAQVGGFRIEW